MARVGQNHIYIRYFWQGDHQIYGANIRFWPTLSMANSAFPFFVMSREAPSCIFPPLYMLGWPSTYIHTYIRRKYIVFSRGSTCIYTYIRFWPTLIICRGGPAGSGGGGERSLCVASTESSTVQ